MRADKRFRRQPKRFWAHVRVLSQRIGYTGHDGKIKIPTRGEVAGALSDLGLTGKYLRGKPGDDLLAYFRHRADILNNTVHQMLMDKESARREFVRLRKNLHPTCPLPMNKQKGDKKTPAYLTCIVNMLIERHAKGMTCDYDPRQLTLVTRQGAPLRTLARRVDGAFPSAVNPIAVWEIKEYYNTTTFGSRVADGVYETLLDGMELEELREHEGVHVRHYLMVDDRYTWWDCGKSYLCRIVDLLHMGYVDEVLFGAEVLGRLPLLVREWVTVARSAKAPNRVAGPAPKMS